MLIDRLRTSAILIAITVTLLYLDANYSVEGAEGLWLLPLLLFFAVGTARDLGGLIAGSGRPLDRPAALLTTALIAVSAAIPLMWPLVGAVYPESCPVGMIGWPVIASVASVFIILIREMIRFRHDVTDTLERAMAGVFVAIYAGLPMALLVGLRALGDGRWGLAALLTTIAVTKSADVGAYFVGSSLGRHKLIPRLSPGKTREGAIGGIVAATLMAAACLQWLFPWIATGAGVALSEDPSLSTGLPSLVWALILGPVLALAGIVGDLAESLVKRAAGAKDSGDWLPGLGGVWDVTDSLIAAVMPAFVAFAAAA